MLVVVIYIDLDWSTNSHTTTPSIGNVSDVNTKIFYKSHKNLDKVCHWLNPPVTCVESGYMWSGGGCEACDRWVFLCFCKWLDTMFASILKGNGLGGGFSYFFCTNFFLTFSINVSLNSYELIERYVSEINWVIAEGTCWYRGFNGDWITHPLTITVKLLIGAGPRLVHNVSFDRVHILLNGQLKKLGSTVTELLCDFFDDTYKNRSIREDHVR